jgi:hypothetical protein
VWPPRSPSPAEEREEQAQHDENDDDADPDACLEDAAPDRTSSPREAAQLDEQHSVKI